MIQSPPTRRAADDVFVDDGWDRPLTAARPGRSAAGLVAVAVATVALGVGLVLAGAALERHRAPGGASVTAPIDGVSVDAVIGRKVAEVRHLERAALVLSFVGVAGTVFVLGVLAFATVIVPPAPDAAAPPARGDPLSRFVRAVGWLAVAGTVGALVLRVGIESGRGLGGITDLRALEIVVAGAVGASASFRVAGVLLALAALAAPAQRLRCPLSFARGGLSVIGGLHVEAPTSRRAAAGVAATVALASFVTVGHAQASEPRLLLVVADVAHVAAASVWFGGVAALALVLRRSTTRPGLLPLLGSDPGSSPRRHVARTVERFSVAAGASVAVVSVAGVAIAWSQVRTLDALVGTAYGVTLLAKLALVGLVLALGGYNHKVAVPAVLREPDDDGAWHHLHRAVVVEAVIILGGVLVASVALAGGGFARWAG